MYSNLICCRGQVQRIFSCDSLAVRRILVLFITSNEHRQLVQCILNGRTDNNNNFCSLLHMLMFFSLLRAFILICYVNFVLFILR